MTETTPMVGILVGSPSDLETVAAARDVLASLGVPSELRALSAHRTPDLTVEYVRGAEQRGIEVIIACAGMAAHLAGTVAAYTLLPVIGVPLGAGRLAGLDSLLATVQMPPGVPVATVAIDGAKNAAFLAARILALKYPAVGVRLDEAMAAERVRYEKAGAAAKERELPSSPAPPARPKASSAAVAKKKRREH
ncbi:MAG: 5-(carboxyamino)imidazole ribonucleotide mutase [Deltaproteobacteria bacterium]|nr:5-(carboxyamino)imidazole ribonucleotide mutase [Deltaproteobacteria bacterium]